MININIQIERLTLALSIELFEIYQTKKSKKHVAESIQRLGGLASAW